MHDDELDPLTAFKPASERYCPKCGEDDLTVHYCEANGGGEIEFEEEEHLAIVCNECGYGFRMSPKEPCVVTPALPEAQKAE